LRDLEEDDDDFDNSSKSNGASSQYEVEPKASSVRKRMYGADSRGLKVSSDLEKMGVKPGPGVKKAVDMIDSWTLLTGR